MANRWKVKIKNIAGVFNEADKKKSWLDNFAESKYVPFLRLLGRPYK